MSCAIPMPEGQPNHGEFSATIGQTIADSDFALFQQLIEKQAGIYLSPAKKSLLVGRLARRLRELGLPSFHEYYRRVTADPVEHIRMIDCISTNETQFFREPLHFDFLEWQVFPRWTSEAAAGRRSRQIRVWSAGCSTGEEPYSLAMTLLHHFPGHNGWHVDILATDISTRALARAREGIWAAEKAGQIPDAYLKAFMLRGTGTQAGKMKAGREIRQAVQFNHFNLLEALEFPGPAQFDLILCRNVMIYFRPETKAKVVRRLLTGLLPDGYLFVGHSESLNHMAEDARSVIPTVYVKPDNFSHR